MALPDDERRKLGANLLTSAAVGTHVAKRRAGSAAGRVHMASDFDAPIADFAEYT